MSQSMCRYPFWDLSLFTGDNGYQSSSIRLYISTIHFVKLSSYESQNPVILIGKTNFKMIDCESKS